ncbi:MAG: RagB/SusD family nutrient uptake outer membrane protein, partial [Duncaniella sp.]|nr:RagB/SusD family nutrient uptake outer membrane protein [Duncaniella sp.]
MLASTTSCNDWLEVKPNNEQITSDFWQSKEDVESVVLSGYVYLCNAVPTLIKWGELRGGTFYSTNTSEARVQNFNLTSSHSLCDYSVIYKIINAANSVIKYAPDVRSIDGTYHEAMMNAHLCEAYFLRAYSNLILVKNFKEVPLVLEPYVDDSAPFDIAKSTEEEIVKQIKNDILDALNTGAAKSRYGDDTWENQGRVTKWALYALMADVCLWSEDYDMCKVY